MVRQFSYTVFDTNGATPKQNAINHMHERTLAQNNLAKSGGGTLAVPQFRSTGPELSPHNANHNIQRAAGLQLKMDSTAKLQDPIKGGFRKKSKKNKKSKKIQRKNTKKNRK
jgi:hypothetical protein